MLFFMQIRKCALPQMVQLTHLNKLDGIEMSWINWTERAVLYGTMAVQELITVTLVLTLKREQLLWCFTTFRPIIVFLQPYWE